MQKVLICLVVALVVPAGSLCQNMALVKPGPLGRPSLVRGEGEGGGNWYTPISVYSDRDLELFVPENLTVGGVYWDGPSYKRNGEYAAYIYSFYKNDHECRIHRIPPGREQDPQWLQACAELRYNRRLVEVDTQKKTITIRQSILMKSDGFPHPDLIRNSAATIPLDVTANPMLFHAITQVTEMLEMELRKHPGNGGIR